jgi:polysaccharide export outer membrane protein
MKKELYLVLLLLILIPFGSVNAQMADLSDAVKMLEKASGQDALQTQEEEKEVDEEEKPTATREKPKTSVGNYGYTGARDFANLPQEKFLDEPLSYFGYDFFFNNPAAFTTPKNLPTPSDYVLGPGDRVVVRLFGSTNTTWELVVSKIGDVFLPGIGPLLVAGETFQDIKQIIEGIITKQMVGTSIGVTMGELRSIEIFVLGDAVVPGMYTISSLTTLTNALFSSGGINVTGSLRNIQLKRKGKVISTLDFYDLLLKGDTSQDVEMKQGDVIFIPPIAKTAGVAGEVVRPGIYELREDETLGDLILFAGNLKPKADIVAAEIQSVSPLGNGFDTHTVNLNDANLDNFELKHGDILNVYPVLNNLANVVLVSGHALQPGFFPWKEGMRIGDLMKSSDGFLSMTDLHYVLIKREDKISRDYTFLQTDLVKVFRNTESDANFVLADRDHIILFPSLITQDQITTRLIQDEYVLDEETQRNVLVGEWGSLTGLRKSLLEQKVEQPDEFKPINPLTGQVIADVDIRRYYEYSVYDYCTVPEALAMVVIESAGFNTKKSVPVEDLKDIKTSEQFQRLLIEIDTENKKTQILSQEDSQLTTSLTRLCRQQLLDPLLEIVNRQTTFDKDKGTVSVFGNVHFPGVYPLTENMFLKDSINAAGGPKDSTYESEIELSRRVSEGKQFSLSNEFVSMSNAQIMQTKLQEMDVITLKQMATNTGIVEITGEVLFAGVYPISENQTLGELVRRAGGITNHGSEKGAYFVRKSLQNAEFKRLEDAKNELKRQVLLSSQAGGLGQSGLNVAAITQLTTLLGNETDIGTLGRLIVDLESILNGTMGDIILEDGDKLHIPTEQQTISVIGEVYMDNSHVFEKNFSVDDYIQLSGGANEFANEDNIYLIKVDGSIVSPSQLSSGAFFRRVSSGGLQPGDTIVVPLQVQPFSGAKAATEITQIIYQMAIAAAAVNSFGR